MTMFKTWIAYGCLFLSGVAALIYEVCWIRRASQAMGSTTLALSTVLSVFFLGLALGSYLFGRYSRDSRTPLRTYALLEAGLAALALLTIPGFELVGDIYGSIYRTLGGGAGLTALLRALLVSAILLPAAVLMGGTLPLFCRQFVVSGSRIAGSVGWLYGLNTTGALAGCAATGFILLPSMGLSRSIQAGALLSLGLAAITWLLRFRRTPDKEERLASETNRRHDSAVLAALFLVSGFIALGSEVLWTRYLGLVVRNTVYTYTLTLTAVLAGIAIGSLATSSFFDRGWPRARIFGFLQVFTGLLILCLMLLPPGTWTRFSEDPKIVFALLLPPAVLSGASFPLVVRMVVITPGQAGGGVGKMAAVNTLGGILGALVVGFLLLPLAGLQGSVIVVTGLSVIAGLSAWLVLDRRAALPARAVISVAAIAAWLLIPGLMRTRIPADFLGAPDELIAYREGVESNVAVLRKEGVVELEIDRWWQGRDRKTHQVTSAHIPALLHPHPHDVLVVGLGIGQTAGRYLLYDVARLDCVDIEPALFELVPLYFDSDWMNDRRVTLIPEDGRSYLAHTAAEYDIISLELGQLFRPDIAAFYTVDFYRDVAERLKKDGLVSQFVPLPFLSREHFRSVVASFLEVFPQSTLWYNTSELLLIGSNRGRPALRADRLALLSDEDVREDLDFSHWGGAAGRLNSPAVFLGGFLTGPAGLATIADGATLLVDDRPSLEHATLGASATEARELDVLDLLTANVESVQTLVAPRLEAALLDSITEVQAGNLRNVEAQAYIRKATALDTESSSDEMIVLLGRAVERNPRNVLATRLLADALVLAAKPQEARTLYEAALALDSDDPHAHRGLAYVLHGTGDLEGAIRHYENVIALRPDDAEAHNNLGAALGRTGDLWAALSHFREAIRIDPGYEEARENAERLDAALGDLSSP